MNKSLIVALALVFSSASFAAEPAKKTDAKPVENTNCVKKDKNGKCPPLPDSPKPTPKKVEKKDDKKAEPAKK